jgi:hypothetical protein
LGDRAQALTFPAAARLRRSSLPRSRFLRCGVELRRDTRALTKQMFQYVALTTLMMD